MEATTICIIGIVVSLLLILLTIVGVLLYSGLFANVVVSAGKPPVGSLVTMYKFGRGPYSETGGIFTEAVCLAPDKRTFGIYYDDPKQVPKDKLRWAVGTILAEGAEMPDFQLAGKYQEEGFKAFHTPAVSNAVTTTFPYNTPLSIFIGVFRVYPALARYIWEKKLCAHPFVEIYDGAEIHFWAPLAKQDEFYVPESLEEINEDTEEEVEISKQSHPVEKGQGEGWQLEGPSQQTLQSNPQAGVTHSDVANGLVRPRSSSRSTEVSYKTAKNVPLTEGGGESIPSEVVEGVQDSGISSRSSHSTPNRSVTPLAQFDFSQVATDSPTGRKSTNLDSSDDLDTLNPPSVGSVSSMDTSCTSQSSCTDTSNTSQSSYTDTSNTSQSSYTDTSYTSDGSATQGSPFYSSDGSHTELVSDASDCDVRQRRSSPHTE